MSNNKDTNSGTQHPEPHPAHILSIDAKDGRLFTARLQCPQSPRGLVQILHGMAEHQGRYDELANALCQAGFAVVRHNHRGHGERQPQGLFALESDCHQPGDGWRMVVDDAIRVLQAANHELNAESPSSGASALPLILLGHSMGSFIAQDVASRIGDQLGALVLSGSNYQPAISYQAAALLLKTASLIQQPQSRPLWVNWLVFGSYNKGISPQHSAFDWLSRDHQQVQAYLNDPHCGWLPTLSFWQDLMAGLSHISRMKTLQAMPAELPMYLFGGDRDPVGLYSKGLRQLQQRLQDSGHSDVTLRLYHDGRHEMLNELNRDEVIRELLDWLRQKTGNSPDSIK